MFRYPLGFSRLNIAINNGPFMVTFHSYQRRHGSFERITGGAGDASDLTLEFLEISGKGMGPHWYPQNRFVEMSQNENSLVDIYI